MNTPFYRGEVVPLAPLLPRLVARAKPITIDKDTKVRKFSARDTDRTVFHRGLERQGMQPTLLESSTVFYFYKCVSERDPIAFVRLS